MKKIVFVTFTAFFLALAAKADTWHTPTVDGTISLGEYGNTNQTLTDTGQTWYMTWDNTNLYVAITNANLVEGAIIYIDANPLTPPTSGTNVDGNLSGFNYDGTDVSSLPFRANFVTYLKDGYREFRNSDGIGGWTAATTNYGSYASSASSANTREIAIPWSAITGSGRPEDFDFLGYLTSSGGFVFGQVPNDNPSEFIGTSAVYTQYFNVADTGDGTSSSPFDSEEPQPNTAVPEPSAFLQLGTGLLILAGAITKSK